MRTQLVTCVCAVTLGLVGPLEAAAQDTGSDQGNTLGSSVTLDKTRRSPALDLSRWTGVSGFT